MADDKTILKLKVLVTHSNGEAIKQPEKVKVTTKKGPDGNMVPKSPQEIFAEAPELTRGELLSGILMNGITPETAQEAAELNRLSKRINNLMMKKDAIWEVDEATIDKLIKLIERVQLNQGIQLTIGDIMTMLEEGKSELLAKRLKPALEQ